MVVKENSNQWESCQNESRRKPPPGTGLTQVSPAKTASDGQVSWGLHSPGWNEAHPGNGLTAQAVWTVAVHTGFDSYGFQIFFIVALQWWRAAPLNSSVRSPRKQWGSFRH